MSDQTAEAPQKSLTIQRNTGLTPQNLGEAIDIAKMLAASDAIPREFIGKPANVLLAVMHGHAVGLSPAQALSSMMVVNNRVSIWGDALLGIVKCSPDYEGSEDSYDPAIEGGQVKFTVKRRGEKLLTRTFSVEDAKRAGLWGKAGPWTGYPKRMLYMRARAFALRDMFGDVLKGLRVVEEERDVIETTAVRETGGAAAAEVRAEVEELAPQALTPAQSVRAAAEAPAERAQPDQQAAPPTAPATPAPAAAGKRRRF